jgi:uncharacterized membrane protein HdeD (DUF308 family)
MSGNLFGPGTKALAGLPQKWGWFFGLGIVLILCGVLILGDTIAATLVSVLFIGAALIVGGAFQVFHALKNKEWAGFMFGLICGFMYILGGILIIKEPLHGSFIITLLLAIALIFGGTLRTLISLGHRELAGWWFLALGGVISVVLGIMIFASLPFSSLWVLGMLVGIEMMIQGFAWVQMGLVLRGKV